MFFPQQSFAKTVSQTIAGTIPKIDILSKEILIF